MVIFFYTLSVSLMILLPVFFAALLRRKIALPWLLFCAGMLTFAASQAVHLPLNHWLGDLGILSGQGTAAEGNPPLWQTALVAGLTAGLCEELARTAGYAILRRYRTLGEGVMIGLGHGGLEAMVFGGVMVASSVGALYPLRNADLSTLSLSPEQLAAVEQQIRMLLASPWLAFAPLIERLLAMGIHLVLSVIVLRAFQKRNVLYIILAIAYHAAIDAAAVYLTTTAGVTQSSMSAWTFEGLFALVCLPGYLWLFWAFRREASAAQASLAHDAPSIAHEVAVFWTALRKEMLQQWRTRRVLIIAAVFGLFGMFSPLIAYFIPQVFTAIPGVEQFASLIPAPTAADAMQQYTKNLTQFGFILALLLGMGAVAGEKEHGTASLVLSKPMTRSVFVISKFTAQMAVYLLGFALALVGAYFYTLVLFGDLKLDLFALLNLVLIFWMLPYIAITLLGSIIGKTTGAAAGISLAGMVVLLLLSSLPQISALMPGALSGWADRLGSQAAGGLAAAFSSTAAAGQTASALLPPAVGALASSVVITVICLVAGVAIFEQQEL